MGTHLEDQGEGQRFVVTCDACGAEIVGADLADRDDKRVQAGWAQQAGEQDRCPSSQSPLQSFAGPR
jgi:hypothetical protein